jgi:transposase
LDSILSPRPGDDDFFNSLLGRTCGFVETKTPKQQACLMLHRTRHLFIKQQTSVINAIRSAL